MNQEEISFEKDPRESTASKFLLPLIILAGAVLRLVGLGNNSLWTDEMYTVWVSRMPAGSFFTALSSWGHPPLYYLLVRVWFALDSSDAWSRSISYASGVAIIFLVYLLGKELFSRQVGLWAALLVSLSPLLVSYSRDATLYSWLTALTLLSFYLLSKSIIKGGWRNWALFTLAALVTVFTHLFSFVLLIAFAVVYFILRDRERRSLRPFLTSNLALAAAFIISWQISSNANGLINVKFPMKIILLKLTLIPYVLLGGGYNDFGAGIGGMITGYGPDRPRLVAAVLLILLAMAAAGFLSSRSLRRAFMSRRVFALVSFTVIATVIPVLLHNVLDISGQPSQRFYVWAAPIFLLLIALAIATLSKMWKVVAAGILIAGFLAMNVWGIFFYRSLDFRTPLTFVSTKYQKGDLLFCPVYDISVLATGHYLPEGLKMGGLLLPADGQGPDQYDYFSNDGEIFTYTVENPKTIDGKYLSSGEDLKEKVRDSIKGTERVWLVTFYDNNGDEYCPGCDILGSVLADGWQEQDWPQDSGMVRLYTRIPAVTQAPAPVTGNQ